MSFELPIFYCPNKKKLSTEIHEDLELVETKDISNISIYKYIFKPETKQGIQCLHKWKEYYTTNTLFLKDNQKFLKKMSKNKINKEIIETTYNDCKEIKDNENFIDMYQYMEWDKLKWLNYSSTFLTITGYYNLTSPIVNLILPILFLFVPFFFLKMMKLPVTFETYKQILLKQLKNHIIGKLFTEFKHLKWSKKIYLLFSFGMYIFNFYQNILSCYRFYKNMKGINNTFLNMNNYLKYSVEQMNFVLKKIKKLKTFTIFKQKLILQKKCLENFYNSIKIISTKSISIIKLSQLGYMMKHYYMLYDDEELDEALQYSFHFNGFLDTICGLNNNIKEKFLNKAKFIKEGNIKMINKYHPSLMYEKPIKNNIILDNNKIITGPNAAGKTTLIKSSILNIIFSQQFGYGFFTKAEIIPFDFFHCYLNIPDTSGRDSLFQAEAKRCKKILDIIEQNPTKKHFCIFDELFSGTNPYEAIGSAYSYLNYISKNENVRFMLTTHYIRLCKLCDDKKNIKNYNMETFITKNNEKYTYKLISGISLIKGGICVLCKLNYPSEILEKTKKCIEKL